MRVVRSSEPYVLGMYLQVHYYAFATVSKYADHEYPVAVDQVRGVPGLMTILERK
jgi:hypothetical protein